MSDNVSYRKESAGMYSREGGFQRPNSKMEKDSCSGTELNVTASVGEVKTSQMTSPISLAASRNDEVVHSVSNDDASLSMSMSKLSVQDEASHSRSDTSTHTQLLTDIDMDQATPIAYKTNQDGTERGPPTSDNVVKEEKKSDDDNVNHGDNDNDDDDDDQSDEMVDVDGVFVTNEEYAAVKKLQESYDEQTDLLNEEVARCQRLQRRIESLEREVGRLDQARTNENARWDITVNQRGRTDK